MTPAIDHSLRATVVWMVVVAFLVVFAAGAAKPLLLDNVDFPAMAQATLHTGVPVYYRGESHPHRLGLFHPPLYAYMLAAWFMALGEGAAQARLFGAVCALLQGICTLLLIRELFGRAYEEVISPWFWLVFLLNAYTIQTASIADIDSTIYGPLILLLLWSVVRLTWKNGELRHDRVSLLERLGCGFLLTACLWAKLTTIWLVLPFLFLLLIRRFGWFGAAKFTVLLSAGGILAFLATYWCFGIITRLCISYTFSFTWMSFRVRGASGSVGMAGWIADRLHNFRAMVPFMIGWTGLLPWLAALAAAAWGSYKTVHDKDRRLEDATLILALALASVAYYCAQLQSFGAAPFKYAFVYWGVILAAVVMVVVPPGPETRLPRLRMPAACLGFWVVAAVVGASLVKDRTLAALYGSNAIRWPWVLPAAVFCVGLLLPRTAAVTRVLLAASLASYAGLQTGMAAAQNGQREYATTYDYGERGFEDTVGYIRCHTGPGDIIISMKDIGFASRRRYFENYGALYHGEKQAEELRDLLRSGHAKLAVFTEAHGQDQLIVNPALHDWINQNCQQLAAFGDYRIYRYVGAAQLERH